MSRLTVTCRVRASHPRVATPSGMCARWTRCGVGVGAGGATGFDDPHAATAAAMATAVAAHARPPGRRSGRMIGLVARSCSDLRVVGVAVCRGDDDVNGDDPAVVEDV